MISANGFTEGPDGNLKWQSNRGIYGDQTKACRTI